MKKTVPVLLTWDVDNWLGFTRENRKRAVGLASGLLDELGIKATFLVAAAAAESLSDEISGLIRSGHEIGCHGLTHGNEEEYDTMPEYLQRSYLSEATRILRNITSDSITTFRAPRVKISHITHSILEELGYTADCSVASQRCDLVSSNLINAGWLFAPRLPYHPSENSAFKKGRKKILVVPISALILPFISSALYVFRLWFMKRFFDVLRLESMRSGKPIVYLLHPEEFVEPAAEARISLPFFKRVCVHGFLFRAKFYEKDREKRLAMNRELFLYMKSRRNVRFSTVKDFVSGYQKYSAEVKNAGVYAGT